MRNRLQYTTRRSDMNKFLCDLQEVSKDVRLTEGLIYSLFCRYGLKDEDLDSRTNTGVNIEDLFKIWHDRFNPEPQSRRLGNSEKKRHRYKNTNAERGWGDFKSFYIFQNNKVEDSSQFIKMYIPIDKEHIEDSVNLIFDFLDRENIIHNSKVADNIRSDNIVIRIYKDDIKSRDKIIKFITKNKYIKKGLNKPNPFIPTVDGVGVIDEHGNSYNSDITYYLEDYIRLCNINKIVASADGFNQYLHNCEKQGIRLDKKPYFDYELLASFETAYYGKPMEFSFSQKRTMFMNAISNMFRNKGFLRTIQAIRSIIENDNYELITTDKNTINLKTNLERYVSKNDILEIMNEKISGLNNSTQASLDDKISIFCHSTFGEQTVYDFDEICGASLLKYGEDHLRQALAEYILRGDVDSFTRHYKNSSINYREMLAQIDRKEIYNIINNSLLKKGIVLNNPSIDDYIDSYVSALSRSFYEDETKREMA